MENNHDAEYVNLSNSLLMTRKSDDDNFLWHELEDQRNIEIQQYRSSHSGYRLQKPNVKALQQVLNQTSLAISSVAKSATAAVKKGVGNHHKREFDSGNIYKGPYSTSSRNAQYNSSASHRATLADYGLHSTLLSTSSTPSLLSKDKSSCDRKLLGGDASGLENPLLSHSDSFNFDIEDDRKQVDQSKNPFILLNKFNLRPNKDGWGAVANLDTFFTSIYNYYYHKGLVLLLAKEILEIVSLFFTLFLSVFLFSYLDWAKLITCTDEESCQSHLSGYIIQSPFSSPSKWNILVILYIFLFTVYGFFSIATFFTTVRHGLEAKYVFEDKLGISSQQLECGAVAWDDVVQKLMKLQKSGEYKIAIQGQDFDELIVSQRILRRENFMVAFFNASLLDLGVSSPLNIQDSWFTKLSFFSKSLELSIYFSILSYMFNHKYYVRPAFYEDPASLRRRFIFCGCIHASFMPFLILFMTLHFVMHNMYNFRSAEQYLGPREWSTVAKWSFREFNELPHVFERRLGPSYEAAEGYLKQFTSSAVMHSVGKALVFICGSLGAILLLLAAINDAILLHVKVGNWNLLWYVGILGVGYSTGKGMIPDIKIHPPYTRNMFVEMDSALAQVAKHTHYYPEYWKRRGWDDLVKKSFAELYQYKAKLFIMELLSIVIAPFVLCFSLPKCAEKICRFVQKTKIEVNGAGDHCGFSTFDFETFEDEKWDGQEIKKGNNRDQSSGARNEVVTTTSNNVKISVKDLPIPKTRHGKMEKSFINFKTVHPTWKCSSAGQNLIDRMEKYQAQKAIELAKEAQHHIEAAARQLETLENVEKGSSQFHGYEQNFQKIDESYFLRREKTVTNDMRQSMNDDGDHSSGLQNIKPCNINITNKLSFDENSSSSGSLNSQPKLPSVSNILHYGDINLSTELQNVLDYSTLKSGVSFGSLLQDNIPKDTQNNNTSDRANLNSSVSSNSCENKQVI